MSDEEVLELFELHTGAAFETSLQEELLSKRAELRAMLEGKE